MKVGILRETKNPPDKRVVLTPNQAISFQEKFPAVELVVQTSKIRCYKDEEYEAVGIKLQDEVNDCDFLMGIKEVNIEALIPGKTYLFFSHTAKMQPHNKPLLKACLDKHITLVDHEYLTNLKGERLVAFGRFAGIVGAYNGFIALGRRTGLFQLKRAKDCKDMEEMYEQLRKVKIPPIAMLLTGGGRVAKGAEEVLNGIGIRQISPDELLNSHFNEPVYAQLDPEHYVERIDGSPFDLQHFFKHPDLYQSTFKPYTKKADLWIACHFWDQRSPNFLKVDDMKENDFRMQIIADVSCDIAGPIPSTIRSSTIAEPFYGYNPFYKSEDEPFKSGMITVMAVDNLPGELPRDASEHFGMALMEQAFPAFFQNDPDKILERATICHDGKLNSHFDYLEDFVNH